MADGTHFDPGRRPALRIALVNNMPDGALQATERQFSGLIAEAARGDFDVDLKLHALASVPRGEQAQTVMRGRYADARALMAEGADALIVTGAEPRMADLRDEPYWDELTALVDWSRASTVSAIWSCLAAHAAVLHMDGIVRQPLATKCSGVFTFERAVDDGLVAGLPSLVRIPHSRRNDLPAAQLEASGYRILTSSPRSGVDIFTRQGASLFVFLQGHPEYDGDTLLREYCRDVGRYLRGQQRDYPLNPFGYFDTATERAFRSIAMRARSNPDPNLLRECSEIAQAMRPGRAWRAHAVMMMRNWLEALAAAKASAEAVARKSA